MVAWYWLLVVYFAGSLSTLTVILFMAGAGQNRDHAAELDEEANTWARQPVGFADQELETDLAVIPDGRARQAEKCICNKCGWSGYTLADAAGFYQHPGCRYTAVPLSRLGPH